VKSRLQKASWALALLIGSLALLSVLFLRPSQTVPASREVLAGDLSLRDQRLYWKDEVVPFAGIMIENYANGLLKSRSTLSNGVLHGLSEGWHTNGVLQVREHFQNGVSHGLRTKWFANGGKMSEAPIEHGKIQGFFRRWHENGPLAEEIRMTDGAPDGTSRAFYPSGALKAQAKLERGKVIEQRFWKEGEAPVVAASPAAR